MRANCSNVIRNRSCAILSDSDRNWLCSVSGGSGLAFRFLGSHAGKPLRARTQSFVAIGSWPVWLFTPMSPSALIHTCLLYTSDAADDLTRVDLGGRRIIK